MKTQSIQIIKDFTMTADGYSSAVDIEIITGYSIQCVWTGSPSGILFLQLSDDHPLANADGNPSPTNWTTMSGSIMDITSPAFQGQTAAWKDTQATYRWVRLGYAFNSGTGVLQARFNAKGISP